MEEDNYRAEMDKVKALIERFGGTIEKVDDWGRRKLSYPIAKQNEGMYTFITYASAGETPREVENRLNLSENVLRYLTVVLDEKAAAKAAAIAAEAAEKEAARAARAAAAAAAAAEAAEKEAVSEEPAEVSAE
ncbi:MAG: 30S ribosomal protein S6 [Defluviitaleaceae bacterium]|nr:30S ribosomal protein S6 [Defluviitaleaceae bacterium]